MAQEDIEKKVGLAWLCAFYGGMLTEKQRQVMALHCEEDMSLSEIAEAAGISRQSVHDMIGRTSRKLIEMEQCLGVAGRFRRMQDGLEECRHAMESKQYDKACQLLEQLIRLDQEESNGL